MAEWFCFKDKERMVETDVLLRHMQLTHYVPGLKCPVCGVEYLTEKTATTIVATLEDMIEQK